jgi:PAS domain S-box-containing protein
MFVAPELRHTGISVVGDVAWGTHFCIFYETKQDLLDILIPFFKTGLESREFCLWIISNSELLKVQEAINALQEVMPDLDRHIAERSIEIVGHDDWFLNGGTFDFRRVASRFKHKVDEALARGYAGMRVNGSPAWLHAKHAKELREFESEIDQLFPHERVIASCTYPIGSSRADFLLDVARKHRFAIARRNGIWDVVETPALTRAKAEIERLNAELEQKVIERTKVLEETTARLRAEIEERKGAEAAVRQSEERFAAFMDNLPGYAWMKDLQGRYVYVNEMVKELPGYESLGKTDAQIWPADLAATYQANDQQVIATKRPLQTIAHFQEQGKQRYIAGSKFPISDNTGAVALVGGVGVDITERIEAEAALRESEAKLKQAQHLAHIGYWERDLIADRITWSKETGRILGLESFGGVPNQAQLLELIHPDDRQHHQQVFNEALQGSRLFDVEVRFVRPDGNIKFVHVRDEIVRDESGNPIRMFGAVQDVTERKQTEQAFRESQQLLQLVLATLPVGVVVTNQAGDIVLFNEASKRIWGGAITSGRQRWAETRGFWHDSGERIAPTAWASARALSQGQTSLNELIDIETYDGRQKIMQNSAAPIRNADGVIVGCVIVNEDVTERVRAEEAVRRSGEHLRLVIDTIPAMAWSVRPDGVVDFLNQRWLDYAGLSLEEYVKDPMGPIHPDDVPRVLEKWHARMAIGEGYEDEMRLRRADGEYRWFLVRTEPLRDEQGNLVKWYGSSTDIEDRKQAEERRRHGEVQLAQAQRLAHIGSWDWDLRTNRVTWSDELYHIFGLQPGTISVAGQVDRFIHPDDLDLGWHMVKRAIASKEPYDYYHRIIRPDGTERIARSRGSIVIDERGEPIKVFGATQDVTELKQAEAKLKETSKQLRALSASRQTAREEESKRIAREIHDELGGALTSWRWDLEEIREVVGEPLDSSQVASLRTKIDAMIKLTETTLDTVRKLSSELRPPALELGLVEALEWQVLQFRERTGIAAELVCPMQKVDLDNGAATAVFRILQEALTNIQRHAQATQVTIKCWEESHRFILTIKDNGRGITESEKSASQSLGLLGMSERAQLAGGEINIKNAEDGGTRITVSIPVTDRELATHD